MTKPPFLSKNLKNHTNQEWLPDVKKKEEQLPFFKRFITDTAFTLSFTASTLWQKLTLFFVFTQRPKSHPRVLLRLLRHWKCSLLFGGGW